MKPTNAGLDRYYRPPTTWPIGAPRRPLCRTLWVMLGAIGREFHAAHRVLRARGCSAWPAVERDCQTPGAVFSQGGNDMNTIAIRQQWNAPFNPSRDE